MTGRFVSSVRPSRLPQNIVHGHHQYHHCLLTSPLFIPSRSSLSLIPFYLTCRVVAHICIHKDRGRTVFKKDPQDNQEDQEDRSHDPKRTASMRCIGYITHRRCPFCVNVDPVQMYIQEVADDTTRAGRWEELRLPRWALLLVPIMSGHGGHPRNSNVPAHLPFYEFI